MVLETDSPLEPSAAHLERIRVRAYHLWLNEGCPSGQADAIWERAQELDALETNCPAQLPNPLNQPEKLRWEGTLVEEASLQENLGEFPALFTDQGDTMPTPESRESAREFRDGER